MDIFSYMWESDHLMQKGIIEWLLTDAKSNNEHYTDPSIDSDYCKGRETDIGSAFLQ